MKRGLSGVLRGRPRQAFFFYAFIRSRKTTRVGRETPREIRRPTREKEGKYIAISCFHVFIASRRTRQILLPS